MSDLRFCPACGAQLPRVAGVPVRFCPGCGVRLEGVACGSDATGSVNDAAADDGASEGREPGVAVLTDVPTQSAKAASPSGDTTSADASRAGELELHAACDTSGGQALAQVALPRGWHIEEAHLERSGSFDCPISVGVTAAGPMGERVMYRSELCYVDAGAVTKRIPTQTERKVFVHVEAACDELAQACAARLGARAEVVAEQPYPSSAAVDIERERTRVKREAANDFAIQGFSMEPSNVIYECRMRRYRLTGAPVPTELAVAAKVEGYMFSIGGVAGSLGKGVAAGAEALLGAGLSSGLIGGVLGKRLRERQAAAAAGQGVAQEQSTGRGGCPDGASFELGAADLLQWRIRDSFCLVAPEGRLDEAASTALASMASTLRLNPAIAREASAQKQQMVLEQRQRTQMNIAQQQQQFAAWQQMHASQQAAFDSYQQAWFDRSDRQHAANMAASAANFSSVGVGTGAASYSDAIRGVNHYVRPDGTDVEVSVMADQAWVNGSGDVVGTRDGFEPGFGWTELPRQ